MQTRMSLFFVTHMRKQQAIWIHCENLVLNDRTNAFRWKINKSPIQMRSKNINICFSHSMHTTGNAHRQWTMTVHYCPAIYRAQKVNSQYLEGTRMYVVSLQFSIFYIFFLLSLLLFLPPQPHSLALGMSSSCLTAPTSSVTQQLCFSHCVHFTTDAVYEFCLQSSKNNLLNARTHTHTIPKMETCQHNTNKQQSLSIVWNKQYFTM